MSLAAIAPTRRLIQAMNVARPRSATAAEIGRAHVWNSSHSQMSYAVFCLKKKIEALNTQKTTRDGVISRQRRSSNLSSQVLQSFRQHRSANIVRRTFSTR